MSSSVSAQVDVKRWVELFGVPSDLSLKFVEPVLVDGILQIPKSVLTAGRARLSSCLVGQFSGRPPKERDLHVIANRLWGRDGLCRVSILPDSEERHAAIHLEGIPYYVPRSSDVSGQDMSNRLAGRGLRDSPRRFVDGESFFGMKSTRSSSAPSLILQPSTRGMLDPKCERSVPKGTSVKYPLRGTHYIPFSQQLNASRFGDFDDESFFGCVELQANIIGMLESAIGNIVSAVFDAASDKEPKVRLDVASVMELLLQARLIDAMVEIVLEKLW
ncbi:hypothetical protein LINPERHAP2_LOCUS38292 [Linum perenne]